MKTKLLQKAKELNINVIGKENTITMGQVIILASELKVSGFEVMNLISEINK